MRAKIAISKIGFALMVLMSLALAGGSLAVSGATLRQAQGRLLRQVQGTTYYVGQTNCSDTGPGDYQTPFCSFETALAHLQPGDTLIIKAGTYTERLVVTGLAATTDAPIVIRGESRDTVIFDGGCPDFPCSINDVDRDLWWDLVEWASVEGMVNIQDSSFITLRDFTVQNAIAAGVSVFGGTGNVITHVTTNGTGNSGLLLADTANLTVIHNDVGRAQLGFRDEDGNMHIGYHEALSIVAVSNFVVTYNYVHDTQKEGITVKESSTNGEVHHNFVERACAVGIYIDEAHYVQVYNNQVRRSGYYLADDGQEQLCGSHPVYSDWHGQYYGNGTMLAVGDLGEAGRGRLSNVRVYQNVVWDAHGNGLQFWDELQESGTGVGEMTGNQVYNNVFYNSALAGIRLDDVDDTVVANNIIALNDEEGITGNSIAINTVSHNLFYFKYDWHQPAGTNYVIDDPLLVDPASGDFHLREGSPAIDAGTNEGAPEVDFDGNPRPLDGNSDGMAVVDIGADEFTLLGDLDHDCDVDVADIMLVASHWHSSVGDDDYSPIYDLDEDGDIDIVDIMLVAVHWGENCGQ